MITKIQMRLTRRQHLIENLHMAFGLAAGGILTSVAGGAAAQSGEVPWPTSKPIKLLIPAQPGGGLDLVARTTADRLARLMSVPWVCENIGGGGGSIAATTVARAAPDGQTFMITNISTHGTNPAVRKLTYDAIKDFSHVAMVGGTPNVLLCGPTLSQVGSVEELIARIKARDGQAAYGSAGPGTSSHLLMEQFKAATGTQLTHVPYRGIGPAMVDLLAGRTDIAFPGLTAAASFIKSSRLKPLAVTSRTRQTMLPDVPTFAEIGMKDFSSLQWYGLSGPARLPVSIVKLLNSQVNKVLADPEVIAKFSGEALSVMPMTSQEFSAFIAEDIRKWIKLVKDQKIEVETS